MEVAVRGSPPRGVGGAQHGALAARLDERKNVAPPPSMVGGRQKGRARRMRYGGCELSAAATRPRWQESSVRRRRGTVDGEKRGSADADTASGKEEGLAGVRVTPSAAVAETSAAAPPELDARLYTWGGGASHRPAAAGPGGRGTGNRGSWAPLAGPPTRPFGGTATDTARPGGREPPNTPTPPPPPSPPTLSIPHPDAPPLPGHPIGVAAATAGTPGGVYAADQTEAATSRPAGVRKEARRVACRGGGGGRRGGRWRRGEPPAGALGRASVRDGWGGGGRGGGGGGAGAFQALRVGRSPPPPRGRAWGGGTRTREDGRASERPAGQAGTRGGRLEGRSAVGYCTREAGPRGDRSGVPASRVQVAYPLTRTRATASSARSALTGASRRQRGCASAASRPNVRVRDAQGGAAWTACQRARPDQRPPMRWRAGRRCSVAAAAAGAESQDGTAPIRPHRVKQQPLRAHERPRSEAATRHGRFHEHGPRWFFLTRDLVSIFVGSS